LDTHIWLWLVLGTGKLSEPARTAIVSAVSLGELRISVITVWEVAMLASRNRLSLGKPTVRWVEDAIAASAVTIEPLSPGIAVDSCELPDAFHADPADRMIVATARITGARLMTQDRKILEYAALGHLDILPA
jgi:PIN domain nuclease of toxin-antitoxin system